MIHESVAFSFIQLLSEVGGLIGMYFLIVESVGSNINENVITSNVVDKLYFVDG